MANVPIYINLLFILTTCFAVWQFFKAAGRSKRVLFVLLWMLLQGAVGLTGFYQETQALPPRFIFLVAPTLIFIVILFLTSKGKRFIDNLSLKELTLLHVVRVPVEICLYFLFLSKLIPGIMTFEGYNYDIISGISAILIYLLIFVLKKANEKILLVWNIVCLLLLLNIVIIAVLSVQTPFQQLAFDQPNIGLTYFPFVWLPSVVVPLVLLSHLAAIRQLLAKPKKEQVILFS